MLVHERRPAHGACEFDHFFAHCSRELSSVLFKELAVPFYGGLYLPISLAMLGKKFGAKPLSHVANLKRRRNLVKATKDSRVTMPSTESNARTPASTLLARSLPAPCQVLGSSPCQVAGKLIASTRASAGVASNARDTSTSTSAYEA